MFLSVHRTHTNRIETNHPHVMLGVFVCEAAIVQRTAKGSKYPLSIAHSGHAKRMHAYASPYRLMLCHCLQQIEGVTRNFTLILLFCEDTVIKCFTIILTRFTLENISVLLCTQIHLLALTLTLLLTCLHWPYDTAPAGFHSRSYFVTFFSALKIYFDFSFFSPPVTRQI